MDRYLTQAWPWLNENGKLLDYWTGYDFVLFVTPSLSHQLLSLVTNSIRLTKKDAPFTWLLALRGQWCRWLTCSLSHACWIGSLHDVLLDQPLRRTNTCPHHPNSQHELKFLELELFLKLCHYNYSADLFVSALVHSHLASLFMAFWWDDDVKKFGRLRNMWGQIWFIRFLMLSFTNILDSINSTLALSKHEQFYWQRSNI